MVVTSDHMIQLRSPGQMMTLSTMRWPGRAEEGERREREESVWREICWLVPMLVSCVPALGAQPDQHRPVFPVTVE